MVFADVVISDWPQAVAHIRQFYEDDGNVSAVAEEDDQIDPADAYDEADEMIHVAHDFREDGTPLDEDGKPIDLGTHTLPHTTDLTHRLTVSVYCTYLLVTWRRMISASFHVHSMFGAELMDILFSDEIGGCTIRHYNQVSCSGFSGFLRF